MELLVGCCGWDYLRGEDLGIANWRSRYPHKLALYAAHFPVVEVNSTFYRLPRVTTAERWRALADGVDETFEFTVKVNREVTHRARFRGEKALDAFRRTLEIATALRSRVLLLQTPPSFGPEPKNVEALRMFLEKIPRGEVQLVWEPRGNWGEELVAGIVREYGLVHCSDPFRRMPIPQGPFVYVRLHGSPPGKRMYRYTYTDSDLEWLKGRIAALRKERVYVLFNNDTMYRDALRFRKLWEGK